MRCIVPCRLRCRPQSTGPLVGAPAVGRAGCGVASNCRATVVLLSSWLAPSAKGQPSRGAMAREGKLSRHSPCSRTIGKGKAKAKPEASASTSSSGWSNRATCIKARDGSSKSKKTVLTCALRKGTPPLAKDCCICSTVHSSLRSATKIAWRASASRVSIDAEKVSKSSWPACFSRAGLRLPAALNHMGRHYLMLRFKYTRPHRPVLQLAERPLRKVERLSAGPRALATL